MRVCICAHTHSRLQVSISACHICSGEVLTCSEKEIEGKLVQPVCTCARPHFVFGMRKDWSVNVCNYMILCVAE